MPRIEETLSALAALPGVRAAVLAGFDGLLVDEAVAAAVAADTDTAEALIGDAQVPDAGVEDRGDAVEVGEVVAAAGGQGGNGADERGDGGDERGVGRASVSLDGAVVELTHAWNGVRRACTDYLAGGTARELIVMADDGAVVAQVVAEAWFVFLWTAPDADLATTRAALRDAAENLAAVVR